MTHPPPLSADAGKPSTRDMTIALIGNPNCGKTTLFNALTGLNQRVGNWPGVTVERISGTYRSPRHDIEIIDLPGAYSIDISNEERSLDEKITCDYLHSASADLILNIVDASNLERNLYLTLQLAEMRLPMLVVVNMTDIAAKKGLQIDCAELAAALGCPVVATIAATGKGIEEVRREIDAALRARPIPSAEPRYGTEVEQAITALRPQLEGVTAKHAISLRYLACRLFEQDRLVQSWVPEAVCLQAQELARQFSDDAGIVIADARYRLANTLTSRCLGGNGTRKRDITESIDRFVLNRVIGIPFFLFMMYLLFMFTIHFGGAFIDFFDQLSAALFVDGLSYLLGIIATPEWLNILLSIGIGGGVQVVATFIPIIGSLYLFLSLLEDSGYMARAAFVMDRSMRAIGLPGKSFVPLIVGFGCNIPAIMATRTLEHRRDRLMTIAMAPFMSCGARLPVYVLFAAAFFPRNGQNLVFALYLLGILAAVVTGLVLKKTLLRGETSPFIMELPPYHLPTLKGILIHTWNRLKGFIVKAGRIIIPMVLVLNFLNAVGPDGSFGNQSTGKSVLAAIGRSITPVFSPMGLREENWPASVGIFTGVLAKEAVIGTLNAQYAALAERNEDAEDTGFDFVTAIKDSFATIPANLSAALDQWSDPLGLGAAKNTDRDAVATDNDVDTAIFGSMVTRFDGIIGAFAYLLFILLYFPCTAAINAVYQESGARWALFVAFWTTGIAYLSATGFYQSATFSRHPQSSLAILSVIALIVFATLFLMRRYGTRDGHIIGQETNLPGPIPARDRCH